ncbi:hypothetical protein D9758_004812 [Tetrapyrgos nigripes]|uniref:SET domain-containing protein n=1 Tax=Tetrapyrgos nigripes TaxID=182062 RepID=A0A8H5G622_9AGAR|nr:hypothetical protein D9758_004812 [Tetrapyrgos nigripes]
MARTNIAKKKSKVIKLRDEEDQILGESSESETEMPEFDANKNWEFDIVGEEITGRKETLRYELNWPDWDGWPDGGTNTWLTREEAKAELGEDPLKNWNDRMAVKRKSLARQSAVIDDVWWAQMDILSEPDYHRSQAVPERLKHRKKKALDLDSKMERLLAKHEGRSPPQTPGRSLRAETVESDVRRSSRRGESILSTASTLRSTSSFTSFSQIHQLSTPSTSGSGSKRALSSVTNSPPTKYASVVDVLNSRASSSTMSTRSYRTQSSSRSSVSSLTTPPTSIASYSSSSSKGKERTPVVEVPMLPRKRSLTSRPPSKQKALGDKWTAIARKEGAASITFVNTVDHEELPSLSRHFVYQESNYNYSDKAITVFDSALIVGCECIECVAAHQCSCQGESEILDDTQTYRVFAYDEEGLFRFNVPEGTEVIECNQSCSCSIDCPNRVAQRPRRFPLEIFKTENYGWGVRSTVHIEKGRVLGHYSGKVIPRERADQLDREEGMYCFNIDGREDPEAAIADAYSVDARECGNWTRFLKYISRSPYCDRLLIVRLAKSHSCSPNIKVYLAVWDTIPENKMPNIVFAALEDIPARTEFTFDYDPSAPNPNKSKKGKGKAQIPEGARPCFCETAECRGYVRV